MIIFKRIIPKFHYALKDGPHEYAMFYKWIGYTGDPIFSYTNMSTNIKERVTYVVIENPIVYSINDGCSQTYPYKTGHFNLLTKQLVFKEL